MLCVSGDVALGHVGFRSAPILTLQRGTTPCSSCGKTSSTCLFLERTQRFAVRRVFFFCHATHVLLLVVEILGGDRLVSPIAIYSRVRTWVRLPTLVAEVFMAAKSVQSANEVSFHAIEAAHTFLKLQKIHERPRCKSRLSRK